MLIGPFDQAVIYWSYLYPTDTVKQRNKLRKCDGELTIEGEGLSLRISLAGLGGTGVLGVLGVLGVSTVVPGATASLLKNDSNLARSSFVSVFDGRPMRTRASRWDS